MLRLFREHRDLSYLLLSIVVSELGTWFTYMLMIVAVYNQSKSVLTTMILTGSSMIAGLIGGQIAGVYVENRQPKRILIQSNWVSAAVIASVFLLPLNVWLYAVGSFLIAYINTYRAPAFEKYLVAAVSKEHRMTANSSFQMANQAVQIIGPALAVFVLGILPPDLKRIGFLIDSATYICAALILIRLSFFTDIDEAINGQREGHEETNESKKTFLERWKNGLSPLKDILVLNVFIVFLLILYGVSGSDVMLTAHISENHISTYYVGYVLGSLSLGLLLTSMFASKWVAGWPLRVQLGCSGFAMGLSFAFIGFGHTLPAMMTAAFLTGVSNAIFNMSSSTFWQNQITYQQLARFFGFVGSLASTVQLIGMGMNGLISGWLGAGTTMAICGLMIACAGLLLVVSLSFVTPKKQLSDEVKQV